MSYFPQVVTYKEAIAGSINSYFALEGPVMSQMPYESSVVDVLVGPLPNNPNQKVNMQIIEINPFVCTKFSKILEII